MRVIFPLFVSAAMDFTVALGKKSKSLPWAAKKEYTSLERFVFGTHGSSTVLQGKLAPSYGRRYLPSARPGWAQETGLSYLVFSENRFPSEPSCSAMK